ncbi:MAG: hypothetical protein AAF546_05980, partial [Verrucomicrobiota bacterium]
YSAANNTTYYYVVTAIDTAANESASSTEVTSQPSALTLLIFDDFETGFGNWFDGGADCVLDTSGSFVNGTSGVINLQDDTNTSVVSTGDLSLGSSSEVFVEFDFQVASFEGNERFALDVSTDGGVTFPFTARVWINDVDFVDDGSVYNNESVLISGIPLTDQTRIRFRCNASNNGDDVYLDDIKVFER